MRHCAGFQKQVTMTRVVYDFSGSSNEKELHRRLRYFMLRRTKAEVQRHLPPLIREIIDIKIPAKACLNVDLSVLKRSSRSRGKPSHYPRTPKFPTDHGGDQGGTSARGSKSSRSRTANSSRSTLRTRFARPACRSGVVNGDVAQKERDRRIADCKNAEGGYVLACTLDTCCTGIDLSFASIACYSRADVRAIRHFSQSEGRLHRHGQENTVLCQYYIGRGSIDDLIAQAII